MTPPEPRRGGAQARARRVGRAATVPTAPSFGRVADRMTPQVCYLHIGTMKSGTTFLQQMLSHHRGGLAEDGVLFPGRGSYVQQIVAVRDALELPGTVPPARLAGAWEDLLHEFAEWPGATGIISVEYLSVAPVTRIQAIVESLAPATVQVVLTARDLARVMPSTWQENIQNGLTWTWPDFMASVTDLPDADQRAGRRFWRQHDLVRIAEEWAGVVGPERVHLVTLPPSGAPRDLLWQRFCEVVGLDAARYPVEGATLRTNRGLDRATAEMLRRVYDLLGDDVDRGAKLRILKRGLAKAVLAETGDQLPIVLDADEYVWAQRYSEHLVRALAASGIEVVGDLADLVPPDRREVPTEHLREPTETEIAGAAAAASAALLGQLASPGGRARRGSTDQPVE